MNCCPSRQQLQQLLEDRLEEALRETIETHVEACAACQVALGNLSDDDVKVDVQRLREAGPESMPDSERDWVRQLEESPLVPAEPASPPTWADDGPAIQFPGPPTDKGPLGRLASFHIRKQLGAGRFGVVYQAYDELDRLVALKVLKPELAASPRERARFEEEARKAAAVKHDHIVTLHQVGHTPGFPLPYLVLEYLDGEALSDRLRRQEVMEPKEAARIVQQAAWGLAAAHARGLVHRDIKPSNILLEKGTGRAKITDFGLAHVVEDAGALSSESGRVVGTPAYMSPEQVLTPSRVDARSDVYSLGAVLYELLTGEPPFRGRTQLVLQQVVHEELRPPHRLNDLIPRDLETICLRCLQKEPDKRYASASSLAEDLRCFLASEPIRARPIRPWERAVKWARRRPAIAALTATVLVITVLGFGQVAEKARAEAEANQQLQQTLYFSLIALAQHELLLKNWGRAEEILEQCEERWRGWEYYYLKRLRHAPPLTLRLAERRTMGNGFDMAFSPDNRLLALPSGEDAIKVWDVTRSDPVALTPRFILRGHTRRVLGVTFSRDGQRLASTSEDATVKIWDLTASDEQGASATGGRILSALRTLEGHTDRVLGVAFSPGQRELLATASNDRTVRLWNGSTGELLFNFPGQSTPNDYMQLAFSPDGRHLASGSKNNTIGVWDVATGQEVFTLVGHARPVFNVTFSPDGRHLASTGSDFVVKVWDLPLAEPGASAPGGRELSPEYTVPNLAGGVWDTAFSPDGQRLAVAGLEPDGTVGIYEAATGRLILPLRDYIRVVSVAFSADGRRLATAGLDKVVRLWDTKTGQEILTLGGHTDLVGRVLFSPNGQRLASASADGTVRVCDASPFDEAADLHTITLHGHSGAVHGLAFTRDGRLASASADKSIIIWNVETTQAVHTLRGHTLTVYGVAFSPDGWRLFSGSHDGTAKLWDSQNRTVLRTLDGLKGYVRSVAFSPDGRTLATASVELVQLWDAETGQELKRFPADPIHVHCVTFSSDGKYVAAVGNSKCAKVWDVNSGEEVSSFPGHLTRVKSVAFHPSGEYVASGDGDFKVYLWDPTTGREIRTPLSGHTDYVEAIAFSPDGGYLATASWKEVIIWDAKSFAEIKRLGRFAGTIWCVAFSPDGKRLAAGGGYKGKGEIKIWDVSLWEKQPAIGP